MDNGFGKSPIFVIVGEQEQSFPQQPFLLFFDSEHGFLQQSFLHLDLDMCSVVSFWHLPFPLHAHAEFVVIVVNTNNNIILSDIDRMNFIIP